MKIATVGYIQFMSQKISVTITEWDLECILKAVSLEVWNFDFPTTRQVEDKRLADRAVN